MTYWWSERCENRLVWAQVGVNTGWCEHKLVQAWFGINMSWCEHRLMWAEVGVNTGWCEHGFVGDGVSLVWSGQFECLSWGITSISLACVHVCRELPWILDEMEESALRKVGYPLLIWQSRVMLYPLTWIRSNGDGWAWAASSRVEVLAPLRSSLKVMWLATVNRPASTSPNDGL